jgi:chromosome segregation ATPase
MNTHPTPVSDLIVEQFRAGEAHSDGLILTLRDLELNLTAALAEIDRLDVSGIHSCHANCQKSMCVMRRELTAVTEQRDELAESLDFQFKLNRECIDQITTRTKERDEAREQRDRLTEALRECRDDSIELIGERDSWQRESRGDYQERYQSTRDNVTRADAALQSLTTNKS